MIAKTNKDINEAAEANRTLVFRLKSMAYPRASDTQIRRTESQRQQKFPDFIQSRLRFLFRQAREFSGQRDEVVVSSQYQLVFFCFNCRDALVAREDFQFGNLEQQVNRPRQPAE